MPVAPVNTPLAPVIEHYALLLEEQYPGWLSGEHITLSDAYINYMNTHPKANPKQVYDTTIRQLKVIANLNKTIAGQISTGATIIGIAGPATGIGLAKASQDIMHGFNFGNIILRVGEILLGIVLIGVGVAKLTGTANVVSKAVKMGI